MWEYPGNTEDKRNRNVASAGPVSCRVVFRWVLICMVKLMRCLWRNLPDRRRRQDGVWTPLVLINLHMQKGENTIMTHCVTLISSGSLIYHELTPVPWRKPGSVSGEGRPIMVAMPPLVGSETSGSITKWLRRFHRCCVCSSRVYLMFILPYGMIGENGRSKLNNRWSEMFMVPDLQRRIGLGWGRRTSPEPLVQ